MNKNYLFQLNHPAHYHLFKNTIKSLKKAGHNVHISIKNKDILKELLNGYDYFVISEAYRRKNLFSIIQGVIKRDVAFLKLVKRLKPDIMVGTSPEIGHIRRFVNVPAIFFGEDDVTISKELFLGSLTCYPFFDTIISPKGCNNSIWNKKTIFYDGFQKLAYLHPNWFVPDRRKVHLPVNQRYFVLRFSNLDAYHDINASGIDNNIGIELIRILEKHGEVLITSEREIPLEFEKYRFKGNLNDIHHYLYYADFYIGDSQSMAIESAMLGTPSIRFNNFVGRIGVLNELENEYKLTYGIRVNEKNKLINKLNWLLRNYNDTKELLQKRRNKMLTQKIDVTAFMVWFIEKYPDSFKIMKENPDYQYNFK